MSYSPNLTEVIGTIGRVVDRGTGVVARESDMSEDDEAVAVAESCV